jgi:peptidoglycan/LPS O-acetylase OafA/YrhL
MAVHMENAACAGHRVRSQDCWSFPRDLAGRFRVDRITAPATHSRDALRHYVPALDGVRGLAILAVMLCHFTWYASPPDLVGRLAIETLRGGRYGVDLFFVLSGYLITGILYDAKRDRHYFRNFYGRRVLRIFPLYYAVLTLIFIVGPLLIRWDRPGEAAIVRAQGWLWLYATNLKNAFAGPEFFQQGRLWVGHFWSLAIEEQFYLIWPVIILVLSRADAMRLCLALIIGAPLLRVGLYRSLPFPEGLYVTVYFTLCKLDTLALGALLALAARSHSETRSYARYAPVVAIVAALLLAPLVVIKPDKVGTVGAIVESAKLSIVCVMCGALVVHAVRRNGSGSSGKFFVHPGMRFLGKYSYGIYIFHDLCTPLFDGRLSATSLTRALRIPWYAGFAAHLALAFGLSIALALASWNLLEKHMLKLKRFFEHERDRSRARERDAHPAPWRDFIPLPSSRPASPEAIS